MTCLDPALCEAILDAATFLQPNWFDYALAIASTLIAVAALWTAHKATVTSNSALSQASAAADNEAKRSLDNHLGDAISAMADLARDLRDWSQAGALPANYPGAHDVVARLYTARLAADEAETEMLKEFHLAFDKVYEIRQNKATQLGIAHLINILIVWRNGEVNAYNTKSRLDDIKRNPMSAALPPT